MTNFARIIHSVAVDVSHDPESHFHPDIASEFQPVPDDVRAGWRLIDDTWTAPELTEAAVPVAEAKKVSPIEFKLLFTAPERVAIKASTDAIAQDFFSLIEDPRLTQVDLGLQSVKDAIGYLAQQELIEPARVGQILSGNPI